MAVILNTALFERRQRFFLWLLPYSESLLHHIVLETFPNALNGLELWVPS